MTIDLKETHGIVVNVSSQALPKQSSFEHQRFAFAYHVSIENKGSENATLLARHWVITDANGVEEHVRGPGVVGHQPHLKPGQSFEYNSGAILKTTTGTMHGEYLMVREDGTRFEAKVAPFALLQEQEIN